MGLPKSWWLMTSFWQKTHPREQPEKNGAVWMSPSEVRQGYLESSNVDLASEMGKVIEAQRTYSYVLRMMQTADEIETTVNNLTNG